MSDNKMMRTCDSCEHEFDVTTALVEKDKGRIPGIGQVYVVGIECPECKKFFFAGFTSQKLMQESMKLKEILAKKPESAHQVQDYLRRRLQYQKRFNKLNRTLAKRFGIKLPEFPG